MPDKLPTDPPPISPETPPALVALLPMKAHSARVPNKNFRTIAGKPLFRWVLDSLLALPAVARVVINTDARAQLAQAGLEAGGRVLIRDRRADLCGDAVSMNKVLADDIAACPAHAYLMTHTTNPLLSAATLARAIDRFAAVRRDGTADSLFAVTRLQTRLYAADGAPLNHDPDHLIPTQDLAPLYEENSNFYLFTAQSFAATGARIGARPQMVETPKVEAVDIDDADDWAMAEALLLYRQRAQAAAPPAGAPAGAPARDTDSPAAHREPRR
ncbi:CMP-N-acetylneuraminic acid synthetase [Rhodothalassium salexigens DSM 2132]|uniref:CMP-N-acetylneuraminic acid synthetase n=1 Tax=Rhodothalassium salexigens DSM 2132 TaxID=1188247 RepID=A0A4R2PD02_RHOSA|nr:acylneuraminate cytidylyltransferase family protein [Rhodothalassium salexigens]MBB4212175.1 CMP-N-acetylneuraminic acid synthetase [Rhodothalassium salexigens DSM 2132]TCP33049.1 CMP-N-acetylneuraminic acid synthetase [Rhodothalassium salexigens DSM 2132]